MADQTTEQVSADRAILNLMIALEVRRLRELTAQLPDSIEALEAEAHLNLCLVAAQRALESGHE